MKGFSIALIVAVVLGFWNAMVRPILILLTLPVTILTLGLFILVINALLFWFVASFVDGFQVSGLGGVSRGDPLLAHHLGGERAALREDP